MAMTQGETGQDRGGPRPRMNPLAGAIFRLFTNFWARHQPEDQWLMVLKGEDPALRRYRHILALLPSEPRCKFCNAPFRGFGAPLMNLLNRSRSRLNPRFCRICLETIPVGGAEIELAMLFADVRGSTALAEMSGAARFSQLIGRFFIEGTDVLTHSDALIDRLAGDQIIGFFVPGFAGPDYARKALRAGEALLRRTGHDRADGPWIPVGVGIHTGSAFVGAVGSDEGLTNITALGDAVNIAARLSSEAGPGEILVSEATLQAAGLERRDLEPRSLHLKGRSEPVDVRVMSIQPDSPVPTVEKR